MNKGELTRQRIIEDAAPVFNLKGFAGSTMQDVMDATGLEKGGLYRHFASKEELAAEVFRYATARSTRTQTTGLESVEGSVEKLRAYIQRFVDTPSELPGGCPLLNTAVEADDGNPVLKELAREAFANWRERLGKIVAEGVERGEIREGTVPRRVANSMIAALEGALIMSRLEGTKVALLDAQGMLEGMLDGIAVGSKLKH